MSSFSRPLIPPHPSLLGQPALPVSHARICRSKYSASLSRLSLTCMSTFYRQEIPPHPRAAEPIATTHERMLRICRSKYSGSLSRLYPTVTGTTLTIDILPPTPLPRQRNERRTRARTPKNPVDFPGAGHPFNPKTRLL